jgi:hypothetical protein
LQYSCLARPHQIWLFTRLSYYNNRATGHRLANNTAKVNAFSHASGRFARDLRLAESLGNIGTVIALLKAGNLPRGKLQVELRNTDIARSAGMTGDLG